jgi:hypothetical protein
MKIRRERDSVRLGCLFFVQPGADGDGPVGIHGALAFLHVLDQAFLVDDKSGAVGELHLFVEDSVVLGDFAVHVAEKRIGETELLGEFAVRGRAVDADPENLRFVGVDFS